MMNQAQIQQICDEEMRHFAPHTPDYVIQVAAFANDDIWWVGYRHKEATIGDSGTAFDLNIKGPVCYLLHISVQPNYRRQGHGSQLYRICENIARRLGCQWLRQTPSGTTPRGETRRAYLLRRGYQSHGDEVIKDLTDVRQVVKCPQRNPNGTPIADNDIRGCGSTNVQWSEEEHLYDCLDCGIFFADFAADPPHRRRA